MKINTPYNTHDSLYHDTLSFVGISDTSQYPIVQFIRNANSWYRKADSWVWEAAGTWEFDDSNWTDLPVATSTLVDGQQDYTLPSTARKIDRAEVLDASENYQKLIPFDKSQIGDAMDEFMETDGLPKYYDLVGNSILLYPAPATASVTVAKGLQLYFVRDISEFGVTDTSTEPGFDNHFHRIVSLGASYDFCLANGIDDRKKDVRGEIEQLHSELKEHYGFTNREMKPRILPRDTDSI